MLAENGATEVICTVRLGWMTAVVVSVTTGFGDGRLGGGLVKVMTVETAVVWEMNSSREVCMITMELDVVLVM